MNIPSIIFSRAFKNTVDVSGKRRDQGVTLVGLYILNIWKHLDHVLVKPWSHIGHALVTPWSRLAKALVTTFLRNIHCIFKVNSNSMEIQFNLIAFNQFSPQQKT